jgi:hypothetical protein
MEDGRSEHPHRGTTMHRLSVGGDFPGLLFAVGTALIFLIAIPALWYVVACALVVGLVIAAVLQCVDDKPDEFSRLSLKSEAVGDLPAATKADSTSQAQRKSSNTAGALEFKTIPSFRPSH